ncbi:MAG: DTW domain-containing protein [Planctomycetes bacterium]|nr:DTW domain-containing protein [Planctomycetota bacterium]
MPRHTLQPRCAGCGLIPARCLCAKLPRTELPWPLAIVQHGKEAGKPTNTARLVARVVANARLLPFARRGAPWSAAALGGGDVERFVLFPAADARPLDRDWCAARRGRPTELVLLDGTWRQAGRMVRRADGIATLPRVALPPGPPSRWRIRSAPRGDQLCTFETVVRLAAIGADAAAAALLERAFQQLLGAQGRNPACDHEAREGGEALDASEALDSDGEFDERDE